MPPVEHRHLADAEPLGKGNHRSIDHTQREVRIPAHGLGHPPDVSPSDLDELKFPGGNQFEKIRLFAVGRTVYLGRYR